MYIIIQLILKLYCPWSQFYSNSLQDCSTCDATAHLWDPKYNAGIWGRIWGRADHTGK